MVEGLASVRDDGTLAVAGRRFSLYGIELAPFGRDCRTSLRPVRCGQRAVLVLDDLVHGFVRCTPVDTVSAVCTVSGRRMFDPPVDLAARLLIEGFALTRENAPYQYRQLEKIAMSRKAGIWGENFIDIR
ncbi:MAG: nuclease-like protein [Geminicoccaceae bacterium]|nr:nuclease-like protein [Geminicoccaceae bacterium]